MPDRTSGSVSAVATRSSPNRERLGSRRKPNDIGFNAVILLGALVMGAVADLAVEFFGVRLPAFFFTAFWGSGAVLLLLAASASKRRKRAPEDRP